MTSSKTSTATTPESSMKSPQMTAVRVSANFELFSWGRGEVSFCLFREPTHHFQFGGCGRVAFLVIHLKRNSPHVQRHRQVALQAYFCPFLRLLEQQHFSSQVQGATASEQPALLLLLLVRRRLGRVWPQFRAPLDHAFKLERL